MYKLLKQLKSYKIWKLSTNDKPRKYLANVSKVLMAIESHYNVGKYKSTINGLHHAHNLKSRVPTYV